VSQRRTEECEISAYSFFARAQIPNGVLSKATADQRVQSSDNKMKSFNPALIGIQDCVIAIR